MNKTEANEVVRKCLMNLTDSQARNLMEHAANKTPIVLGVDIWRIWVTEDAG